MTRLPEDLSTSTPYCVFPEMTLREGFVVPPIVLPPPSASTPMKFGYTVDPLVSVPMKFPSTTVLPPARIPAPPPQPLMARPRTTLGSPLKFGPPFITSPSAVGPAPPPSSQITGWPAYPGWEVPSITVCQDSAGNGEDGAMWIGSSPGTLNTMPRPGP